jgi:hypothetical protein
MAQSNANFYPTPIDNSKVPKEGPQSVAINYDFSAGVQSYTTDMQLIKQQGKISMVQSVYIDNASNTQPVVLTVAGIGQQISVPANFQGIFPVLVTGQPVFNVSSTGNGKSNIYFCNVQQAAFMWQAIAIPLNVGGTLAVSDAILDATVTANKVQTLDTPAGFAITDHSGIITAANTSQVLMAANANRHGFYIQNIDEVILEELRYAFGAAATAAAPGSFILAAAQGPNYPGGFFQGFAYTGSIQIIGATAGHKFTALEW